MIWVLINDRMNFNALLWCMGAGNDFSSAKELKAEMKAVYLERDRLEALAKRLHSLSSGSSQGLARMKEQRQQLRQELEHKEAQHGESHQDNMDCLSTQRRQWGMQQNTKNKASSEQ